jgi:hypothetical protein
LNSYSADSASAGAPDADIYFKPLNTAVTVAYIKTLGPTLINELRSNLTRYADNGLNDNAGVNFGIPRIQVEGYPFGNMQVAGAPQGPDTPAILAENSYEVRDHVTKVVGNHNVRIGGQYRWEQDNDNLIGGARPLYSFSNLWNLANSTPIYEGIYANANTGGPPNAARYFRDHNAALFVQDDWHVTQSLTLNLGLRWEYFSPLTEKRNQLEDLFLSATGPSPLVDAQVRPVSELWNPNYKDFMPKFGFAYAPVGAHEKFVLRGGFGMTYNRQNDVLFANSREDNPNYFNYGLCCGTPTTSFGQPNGPFNEIQLVLGNSTSPNSYPANPALATGVNPRTGTPLGIGGTPGPAIEIYGTSPHLPDAYTFLYSLEAQTEIAHNLALIIGYQGAESRHLIRLLNQNFLYPQSIGPLPTENTSFYAVYFPTPDVNSSYNALNVRLSKTLSHGLSMDATYTWSKSIDMLSAEGPGANTNQTDPVHAQTDEYGPSDFDATHRFNSNVLWTIPFFSHDKGILHGLLGGWQIGGIVSAYSGFPWTPVTGNLQSVATVTSAATIAPVRPTNYYNNAGNNTSNACFITSCNFGGTSPTSTIVGTNYFNITTAGPPGIGRNSFRGPRYFSTDASLGKRFALPFWSEQAGFELRGFAYNLFNNLNLTPFQFGDLDAHVENPNFGRPASAQAGRSIELQARVTF